MNKHESANTVNSPGISEGGIPVTVVKCFFLDKKTVQANNLKQIYMYNNR